MEAKSRESSIPFGSLQDPLYLTGIENDMLCGKLEVCGSRDRWVQHGCAYLF